MYEKIYDDILLKISTISGDAKVIKEFDIDKIIFIKTISKDDEDVLRNLSIEITKNFKVEHINVLTSVTKSNIEILKNEDSPLVLQKIIASISNALTTTRYYITDFLKYCTKSLWDLLPHSIKDPVRSIYSNIFEDLVLRLSKFLDDSIGNKVIGIFGVRMKLTEFLKNLFFLVIIGLVIKYIFFDSYNKTETNVTENFLASAGLIYSYVDIFCEDLDKKDFFASGVSSKDIPDRPLPKNPYGTNEPKTILSRILDFVSSLYNSFKKESISVLGKFAALLIVVPIIVVVLLIVRKIVQNLPEGRFKQVLETSIHSINRRLYINLN